MPRIEVIGVNGIPEIRPGDNLGRLIAVSTGRQGTPVETGDILVVTQKIVSKAEGRLVSLGTVEPSPQASEIAREGNRDPRLVELVLRESRAVVRADRARGILITETSHGYVCANAGIDASNVEARDQVTLLPSDPDASARRVIEELRGEVPGVDLGVIVSDTFGRAWREGQVNFAIGVAGLEPIRDYRGTRDRSGRELAVTRIAVADEIAGSAELVMGKTDGVPVAIVRGYGYTPSDAGSAPLIRDRSTDLFR